MLFLFFRSFAKKAGAKPPLKGMTLPVVMQTAQPMQLSQPSPGVIGDPYQGRPPRISITSFFSRAGWQELYRRFLSNIKSIYALAKCRRVIPGYTLAKFKNDCLDMYESINRHIAKGDKPELRKVGGCWRLLCGKTENPSFAVIQSWI